MYSQTQMMTSKDTHYLLILTVWLLGISLASAQTPTIRIGGIFSEDADREKEAFEFAVERLNTKFPSILPSTQLVTSTDVAPDIFQASRKVCKIMRDSDDSIDMAPGIAALVSVLDEPTTELAESICQTFSLPFLQTRPDLQDIGADSDEYLEKIKINVHPDVKKLSDALLDFVKAFNWQKVVILYQGNQGLVRVKSVLNAGFIQIGSKEQKLDLVLWEMHDIEKTLKELRYNIPNKHIIVDIAPEKIPGFLDIASRMGILTSYHHYMFTTLDLEALNVGNYTWGGVNVTGFRMTDVKSQRSQRLLQDWVHSVRPRKTASQMLMSETAESKHNMLVNISPITEPFDYSDIADDSLKLEVLTNVKTENALMHDAVMLLANVLDVFLEEDDEFSTKAMNCSDKTSEGKWATGESIYNTFSRDEVQFEGLTGRMKIDGRGRRVDFDLDLIEYDTDGNVQIVGVWNTWKGLNITKSAARTQKEIEKDLGNKTLRVVVKEEHPLIIIRTVDENGNVAEGNSRFSGYAIDMMEEISKILNLSYKLYAVPDGSSGSALNNGSWTGLIGELINGNADLALADLTINYERSSVIDFTKPFMNLGISILFKRPAADPPKLFSFLEPLDNNIWMCMLGAYAFVSVFLFVVARFSPYEWKNPHPCNPESDMVENEFTLLNSFWFTIGSLMQQGCELAPKASSTRIIAGVWWFFTLILISSYTANLAAFLTITRMSTPIKNADDLSKQTDIKYGCYFGGSTYSFFKHSKIQTYEKMWNFMSQNDDVFVNSSELGLAKVKAGKYAYLMESIPLRYQLSKHCDLMEVGGELDSKGYGIGVPKESPFRDSLSNAILSLSEQQVLLNLYNKWWEVDSPKCETKDEENSSSSASQLGMRNLGGVFIFLIGGLALALLIALIEFIINAFVNSRTDRQTLWSEVAEECRFAVKCWGPSEKPINQARINGNAVADTDDGLDAGEPLKSESGFTFNA